MISLTHFFKFKKMKFLTFSNKKFNEFMYLKVLFAIAVCFLCHSLSFSQVFVKPVATGAGTGINWDNAFGAGDLETAIEAGGIVYIAAGFYSTTATIDLTNNSIPTVIQGGFPSNAIGIDISGYDFIANPTIIDGGNAGHRLFDNSGVVEIMEIRGLTLQNANPTDAGSVFYSVGGTSNPIDFKFTDLIIQNNSSGTSGTIYISSKQNANDRIAFRNSLYNNNTAPNGPGFTISSCYNSFDGSNAPGNFVITGCVFDNNTATSSSGGALWMSNTHTWIIEKSNFCNNYTSNNGGALGFFISNNNIVDQCTFGGNQASSGGAISIQNGSITIIESSFVNNSSHQSSQSFANGGAIVGQDASYQISDCDFYDNYAGNGGAIHSNGWHSSGLRSTVTNSIFYANESRYAGITTGTNGGGAIAISNNNNGWDIDSSTFVNNEVSAVSYGGAIGNRDARDHCDQ